MVRSYEHNKVYCYWVDKWMNERKKDLFWIIKSFRVNYYFSIHEALFRTIGLHYIDAPYFNHLLLAIQFVPTSHYCKLHYSVSTLLTHKCMCITLCFFKIIRNRICAHIDIFLSFDTTYPKGYAYSHVH